MILKHRIGTSWYFIDSISDVHVVYRNEHDGFDNSVKMCVHMSVFNRKMNTVETVLQTIVDEAYLLNDDGKTIEILFNRYTVLPDGKAPVVAPVNAIRADLDRLAFDNQSGVYK